MPRRLAVILPAILLWTAGTASAQDVRAGVDPRVELLSILFRLAGNPEYHQCRVPAYDKAIEKYFAPFHDHQAVELARSLNTGFNGPMKLAVFVRDFNSLDELTPFDRLSLHLYPTWDASKAQLFLGAARQFAADAKFAGFLQSQHPVYEVTNSRLQDLMQKADLAWLGRFFGPAAPAQLLVVPGLANGAPSYAARVSIDGAQQIYSIPGVSTVDAQGLPVFDGSWRALMVHEFADVYASPAVAKAAARMAKPAGQVYQSVAEAMRQQSCGNWSAMLQESLSRAATIEYVAEHDGPQPAQLLIRRENAHSFFWMAELVQLLDAYRADSRAYPDFESFMPRVADYFDNLAPRMQAIIDRVQPKVVSTSIVQGARDVDPGVTTIAVRFSIPMSRVGPSKDWKSAGGRFDSSGISVTIPIALEPDRDYAFPIRWAGGQSFVSADGVPLSPLVLRFHTAGSAQKPILVPVEQKVN